MALAFAAADADDAPVLLINSEELSERLNPLGTAGFEIVVGHVSRYLHKLSRAAGFSREGMGNNHYNTARLFLPQDILLEPDYQADRLTKLPFDPKLHFHSEVFYENMSSNEGWSWLREPG